MMSVRARAATKFKMEEERMVREKEEAHRAAMNISVDVALDTVQRSHEDAAELVSLLEEHLRTNRSHSHGAHLRSHHHGHKHGFNPPTSIQKARDLLNQMIVETSRKYDAMTEHCRSFFERQCTLLETCRQDISSSNSEAAEWRGKILMSQKDINSCEFNIQRLKLELHQSIMECNQRLGYLRQDLSVVMGDISVMETVLKLTECDNSATGMATSVIAPALLECEHPCKGKPSFVTVSHEGMRKHLSKLQSAEVREIVNRGLKELVEQAPQAMAMVEETRNVSNFTANLTVFENPPLPQTALPDDPCQGISYDDAHVEGAGGCTLRKSPQCFNLLNKFINIQGEIVDKRDALLREIQTLEASCAETKRTLEVDIERWGMKHDGSNTMLAESTSGENTAAEDGRTKSSEHEELTGQMLTTRMSCSTKMRQFESEMCALKKIRGELYKLKGDAAPFFQDCEVSEWEAMECSHSCGGGVQMLQRNIISPAARGGTACPPLRQARACNEQACPIDCKVSEWSGFSSCSAECGGGVRERSRQVLTRPKYDGEPCGDLTETEACNMQSCDVDCDLEEWSPYSTCSKACGGGTMDSRRNVKVAAQGRGKCPMANDPHRLMRHSCNEQPCPRTGSVLKCTAKLDVVLLLDGSGSMGDDGWAKTVQFTTGLLDAFDGNMTDARVAVILFSGPRTWDDYLKCLSPNATQIDQWKVCGIANVQHFTNDIALTKQKVSNLPFPRSSTFTAAALELARQELILGRSDASKVVLVLTDGVPISPAQTAQAAERVREQARLMVGAVKIGERGLQYAEEWVTEKKTDNILNIKDFATLAQVPTMNAFVTDMCPSVFDPSPPMDRNSQFFDEFPPQEMVPEMFMTPAVMP